MNRDWLNWNSRNEENQLEESTTWVLNSSIKIDFIEIPNNSKCCCLVYLAHIFHVWIMIKYKFCLQICPYTSKCDVYIITKILRFIVGTIIFEHYNCCIVNTSAMWLTITTILFLFLNSNSEVMCALLRFHNYDGVHSVLVYTS